MFYFKSSICHVHYIDVLYLKGAFRSGVIICNLPSFAVSDATRTTQT